MRHVLLLTVVLVCGLGVYASARMFARARAAAAGRLPEPSVVERPAARLILGIPNAALGLVYYPAFAIGFGVLAGAARWALVAAALLALLMSAVLAADLLRARASCRNCWTGHLANLALAVVAMATRP